MIFVPKNIRPLITEIFKDAHLGNLVRLKDGISRTLASSKYVQINDHTEIEEHRKHSRRLSSIGIRAGKTLPEKIRSWRNFLLTITGNSGEKSPNIIFALQRTRLMVGMAGSVFENGGLTLDRISGIPFIPGSAIKGCARRASLAALEEWISNPSEFANRTNPLCSFADYFTTPLDLLLAIARIFGWSKDDWKLPEDFQDDDTWARKRSDLAWACGDHWKSMQAEISHQLCAEFDVTPEDPSKPWRSLPSSIGTVCFLPAYPWEEDPGIDIDVLTCHHSIYYAPEPKKENEKKWREWNSHRAAPDNEKPNPHIFPAVRPGQIWAFTLHPTTSAADADLQRARILLKTGLEVFGIGAKTNAGYGWFQTLSSSSIEPNTLHPTVPFQISESDAFLKAWGEKKLNPFSFRQFIQQSLKIHKDIELLRVMQSLVPDEIHHISSNRAFWRGFRTTPGGEQIFRRLQNVISAE